MTNKLVFFLLVISLLTTQNNTTGYIYIGTGPILAESVQFGNNSHFDLDKTFFYAAGLSNQISQFSSIEISWFGQVFYLKLQESRPSRVDTYNLYYLSLAPAIRYSLTDQLGFLIKAQYNMRITDNYSNNTSDPNHPFPSEQLVNFRSNYQLNLATDYKLDPYKIEVTVVPFISDLMSNNFNEIQFKTLFYLTLYYSI